MQITDISVIYLKPKTYRYIAGIEVKSRGAVRERIIRVLLNEPEGNLTKYRLAKNAEASFPWVHEFLGKLEKQRLVRDTRVTDYSGLIKYWLNIRSKPQKKEYMHKDPINLLKQVHMQYALTTYQAENLIQRYLFPSRTDIYIKAEDTEKWHNFITENGLLGKGNVRLLTTDAHIFYNSTKRQGLSIVSIPQLIIDLFEEGGVCTEAAEKLLEKEESRIHAVQAQ